MPLKLFSDWISIKAASRRGGAEAGGGAAADEGEAGGGEEEEEGGRPGMRTQTISEAPCSI